MSGDSDCLFVVVRKDTGEAVRVYGVTHKDKGTIATCSDAMFLVHRSGFWSWEWADAFIPRT